MTKATVENPVVLGSEGSGTIEAIPEGETSFQVGQKAGGFCDCDTFISLSFFVFFGGGVLVVMFSFVFFELSLSGFFLRGKK